MGKNTAKLKAPARAAHKPAAIFIDYPGTEAVHTTLAAFGRADRVSQVIGLITDPDFSVVSVGRTLSEPPYWTIFFRDLPRGSDLILWVYEVARHGRPGTLLFQKQDFKTTVSDLRDPINITYPTSGTTVPQTFAACGNSTVAGAVNGDVDGPVTQPGTELQGPPDWVVQFGGLPVGFPYLLGVQIGNSMAQPSTSLRVQ
jgi:hypothetical protein